MTEQRPATPIDAIAEGWVSTLVDLVPDVAIWIGVPGRTGEYGDLSPEGHDRLASATRELVTQLEAAAPTDAVDEVTKTDLLAESRLSLEAHDAGLHLRDLNVIASPAQEIRESFDLMPTATESDWATIAERMSNLPGAVAGYIATLRAGAERGIVPARRQVREVAEQARRNGRPDGFFDQFAAGASVEGSELPGALRADLERGAAASAEAYRQLGEFLDSELLPVAGEADGVGREHYALRSRHFLGAEIDLDETYAWGIDELERMIDEQTRVASEVLSGATVAEAVAHLEQDPSRKLHGTDALRAWMQELSDRVVDELGRTHFAIPEPVRALECMIAPTQDGGIYYTGPSDDFSRPGRMWWSVPEGVTEFDTWREKTTVFHEGVPGHHLQIGQAVYNRAELNTWRRQLAGTSGHAEGWALYAERLMEELGYLDDPADRLGMLDGQRMRAARVVLDIGVHLGKPKPRIRGLEDLDADGDWDADFALAFMRANVNMDDAFVRFEVNRYLGWPGQAPSYKVGQRIWEQIRDDAQSRAGAKFSFRDFHKNALDLGGVGLDTLRAALLP
ncbi:DUF885 domain-containing protein [Homoserinibacter sp. GY 40078]|uniref:DUF885 domain-containing protein n=1 Tax=Homoserinibacter sp. GY 40078 TaxID=2603275 RepID=UPI0011CA14D9|nr:DUF885 domain-containing protein [Homoserinibacter sp. GY 40078]TXK17573.1 DUF885 domain-containing protein [Homoserinibacter sp. GY 40078]